MLGSKVLVTYCKQILAVLFFFATVFFIASAFSIYSACDDYLQGSYIKILYIHVPAAWLGIGIYIILAISALAYLIIKNPLYDLIACALASVGAAFTLITLVTGSIWGKPTWGTWWVWDARLTSMLILLFTYFGYIGLRQSLNSSESKAALASSVFAIIGLINIPIIKVSVYLWNSLHQKSTFFRVGGPSIHSSMLEPIFFTVPLFGALALIAFVLKFNSILLKRKIDRLKL